MPEARGPPSFEVLAVVAVIGVLNGKGIYEGNVEVPIAGRAPLALGAATLRLTRTTTPAGTLRGRSKCR
jgi:hypothetical protein